MTTLVEKFYRGGEVAGKIDHERYIAEGTLDAEPWLVMDPKGRVREYRHRVAVLRAISARARKSVRPGAMLITEIEWRYLPTSSNKPLAQSARHGVE